VSILEGEPRSLADFARDYTRTPSAYVAWPFPVLVRCDQYEDDEDRAFRTAYAKPDSPRVVGRSAEDAIAYLVRKRPGAAFPERIGVGRASNADVCVPLPRVSKYHAFFTLDERDGYFLSDAGSKNKTFLDGVQLSGMDKAAVRDRARIRLGPYEFEFHDARGFLRLLEQS
jgi:FHA domain